MRSVATVSTVLLGVAAIFGGVSQAAPEWTRIVGLDFWNLSAERATIRANTEREQELSATSATERRRAEVTDGLVVSLCDGTMTLAEAVDRVKALATVNPEWFTRIGDQYRRVQRVAPNATDRDIALCYLFIKMDTLRCAEELRGNPSRAAFISARAVQLNEELRSEKMDSAVTALRR